MTTQLIVVEDLEDWRFGDPGCPVIHVDDYLTGHDYFKLRGVQVINLCRGYRYLSTGYYCSLLAEARRHRVTPTVKSLLDLSSRALYGLDAEDLDEAVQKSFKKHRKDEVESNGAVFRMEVFFGQCRYEALSDLARQIYEIFPCPLLRVSFRRDPRWEITSIRSLSLSRLERDYQAFFVESLAGYMKRRWRSPRMRNPPRYDIAILHNPQDPLPPSDVRALRNFIKAGASLGVEIELVQRKDYARLAEYDALFIRDTTRINHYTYRFAKKAEAEDMVVIDDPQSILRCTNKVYLAELLRANRIPAPKTVIAGEADLKAAEQEIGFPMVLKVPDGSFSRGVVKAENPEQLRTLAPLLLETSDLILAQEFLYTDFDWRIGILNRKPIFACQYFMSKKHWQIVHYDASGRFTEGGFRAWPVEEAPAAVVAVALRAANLIGDGLYGVDVKQNREGVYVIEVNDNPNVEAGVEDGVLKDKLYKLIIEEFVRRLEQRRVSEK
jgi:glutathione synthase/RimK-type ligase-like ATP-grasp enzyme